LVADMAGDCDYCPFRIAFRWTEVGRHPVFAEAAADECGMTLDVGESSAEGAGEVVGIGERVVGHRAAP
jgi:hypothetical protein